MPICLENTNFRYLRKNQNENERNLMSNWWREFTDLFGTYVEYYSHGYTLTGHDFIYGEETLAPFSSGYGMIVLADMSNDSLLLSQFGIQSNADLTVIIPIETYTNAFGATAEPKAGDVIKLSELGWDRFQASRPYPGNISPGTGYNRGTTNCIDIDKNDQGVTTDPLSGGGDETTWRRGAPMFEITERRDDNISMGINNLLGHYVWLVSAKRYDFSWEENMTPESGSEQVTDETLIGELTGGDGRSYNDNITNDSNDEHDYDDGSTDSNDGVYGGY